MKKRILAYLLVAATSALKFFPAVVLSYANKFNFWEILITASVGGIIGVIIYTYFGIRIRDWILKLRKGKKNKQMRFSRRRKIYKIWHKYGIYGIAFLTPPFLSPPLGVAIAVSFKEKPRRIILIMAISFLFWATVLAAIWELGLSDYILNLMP